MTSEPLRTDPIIAIVVWGSILVARHVWLDPVIAPMASWRVRLTPGTP